MNKPIPIFTPERELKHECDRVIRAKVLPRDWVLRHGADALAELGELYTKSAPSYVTYPQSMIGGGQ